jgi:glyoxylase-like metal-dependent hydrolase (beta-lactamase superfamily II)
MTSGPLMRIAQADEAPEPGEPEPAAREEPVLKVEEVGDNVYALIGPLTNRTPENLGNNANFGVIVTDDGIVLVDSGGSYLGAEMIDEAVRTISDQPIKLVINTGGQDHRWFGNGYFKAQGSRILAHEDAVNDQKARLQEQTLRLTTLIGAERVEGTEPVYAETTFTEQEELTLGGTRLVIGYAGHAHTPGDSYVWLPDQRILFSGDIVYVDRMLSIGSQSAHKSWIAAFEVLAALEPAVIVPGHGSVVDLSKAKQDTYDYLVFLRQAVLDLMEGGAGMERVGEIDQSAFDYLANYDTLNGRNAQRVYEELEWE